MKNTARKGLAALFSAGLIALGATSLALASATISGAPALAAAFSGDRDTLLLRDGRILEGKILSENEREVEFQIIMESGLTAKQTFARADILKVTKATEAPVTDAPKPDKPFGPKEAMGAEAPTSGVKVYMVHLTGEFTRDVALTPMKRIMEDAKKFQPEIMIFKVDCDFKKYGEERPDWMPELGSYDQLELTRQLDPIMTDAVRLDPEWKVKPRIVFWVKKALGGVAFLPFLFEEIYYTTDAKHGGIGYLDFVFEGVGDEVVREKQRSLRLGRAEGLAIKGNHPVEIIRAMSRVDYVLSVTFVGGRPEFHNDYSGEVLLCDDGSIEGGRRDTLDEMLRFTGNDVLTLTSDMAQRLGMSRGTVDREDQLFDKLGIARDNPTKVGRADAILEEWSHGVSEAEFAIRALWRELGKVEVRDPAGYPERTQARGRRKAILKDIWAYLEKYKEAINPYAIGAMPDQMITRIKIIIDGIDQEQRRDKPDRK